MAWQPLLSGPLLRKWRWAAELHHNAFDVYISILFFSFFVVWSCAVLVRNSG